MRTRARHDEPVLAPDGRFRPRRRLAEEVPEEAPRVGGHRLGPGRGFLASDLRLGEAGFGGFAVLDGHSTEVLEVVGVGGVSRGGKKGEGEGEKEGRTWMSQMATEARPIQVASWYKCTRDSWRKTSITVCAEWMQL